MLRVSIVAGILVASPHAFGETPGDSLKGCANQRAAEISRVYYQDLLGKDSTGVWTWQLRACGVTTILNSSSLYNVSRPCCGETRWKCFGAQRSDASGIVFFAIPSTFAGGDHQWKYGDIDFRSKILHAPDEGTEQTVFIEAHRREGSTAPYLQQFVFSLRNGIVATSVIDKEGRVEFAQAAISGRGIFDAPSRELTKQ